MAACPDQMGYQTLPVQRWQGEGVDLRDDHIAQEIPVALVYNGISHAVMMASPLDLEDFALGFSLAEGIIEQASDIRSLELQYRDNGIEVQIELSARCFAALKDYRRNLTGRTGCGLCGAESLSQAVRVAQKVSRALPPSAAAIERALASLRSVQPIQSLTGSLHAAAWCDLHGEVVLTREDVGRHNALDKLVGALQRQPHWQEKGGFLLISSRASYEMIQKAAVANMPSIVAVSAPTTLAIDMAQQAGINLIGFARPGQHVIYTTYGEQGV